MDNIAVIAEELDAILEEFSSEGLPNVDRFYDYIEACLSDERKADLIAALVRLVYAYHLLYKRSEQHLDLAENLLQKYSTSSEC